MIIVFILTLLYNVSNVSIQIELNWMESGRCSWVGPWCIRVFRLVSNLATRWSRIIRVISSPNLFLTAHTNKPFLNLFLIWTKFWLYLPFSDSFGTKRHSVWCQINSKSVITIQIWFNLTRFKINFSICSWLVFAYFGWRIGLEFLLSDVTTILWGNFYRYYKRGLIRRPQKCTLII